MLHHPCILGASLAKGTKSKVAELGAMTKLWMCSPKEYHQNFSQKWCVYVEKHPYKPPHTPFDQHALWLHNHTHTHTDIDKHIFKDTLDATQSPTGMSSCTLTRAGVGGKRFVGVVVLARFPAPPEGGSRDGSPGRAYRGGGGAPQHIYLKMINTTR